ncbi:YdcF family protein [Pseudoroseomonas cervicalis]|uniref:YdcF family protein n=1 Tax=Teichococcus cervicalis TaxID=204525 RepID=UPI0022F1A9E1|nr:YdcF family protein [Pseudoroseomonas cervicalis]WBV42643.1 YdcF family protein [Pseudoroseomonas cervicalis]
MSLPDGSREGGWSRLWLLPALLAILVVAGFALFTGQSRARPELPLRQTDGIAVLTGGPQRVDAGLRLLAGGHARALIISGTGRDATLEELARRAGLPDPLPEGFAARVTLGREATSTRGNGQEVAEWAEARQIRSLRVVTAAFHMPRALLELRRTLPGVALVPHPVQAAGPRPGLLLREYGKFIGAMLGLSALKPEKPVP